MSLRRFLVLSSVIALALAACGGDQEKRGRAPDGSHSTAETRSAIGSDANEPDSSYSAGDREQQGIDTDRSAAQKKVKQRKRERDDQGPENRMSLRPKAQSKTGGQGRRRTQRVSKGSRATPLPGRAPMTGAALKRCLVRAVRVKGERRLSAQARCLAMTGHELRRLVVANCRRATKSDMARRKCIKAATGG